MTEPYRFTASKAVALMQKGELTVEDYAKSLLARIKERDEVVKAWAYLDPEFVLAQAKKLDQIPAEKRGPLHGVAIGVKDVILTKGRAFDIKGIVHVTDERPQIFLRGIIQTSTEIILQDRLMLDPSSLSARLVHLFLERQPRLSLRLWGMVDLRQIHMIPLAHLEDHLQVLVLLLEISRSRLVLGRKLEEVQFVLDLSTQFMP
jgi:hypothetical protein